MERIWNATDASQEGPWYVSEWVEEKFVYYDVGKVCGCTNGNYANSKSEMMCTRHFIYPVDSAVAYTSAVLERQGS